MVFGYRPQLTMGPSRTGQPDARPPAAAASKIHRDEICHELFLLPFRALPQESPFADILVKRNIRERPPWPAR
eukprot:1849342-Prymnesium_polylepis.1